MAASQWTLSIRAMRDTPVVDYSAPSVNTTRRVSYRPPMDFSPFHLPRSVSYFEETLWRCGHQWPYVGMGSLGTRLYGDCIAMGDALEISPRVPSTSCSRRVGRWQAMTLPGHEVPRNLGKSEWDQELGKIECVFLLYDKMRWRWDAVCLPQGLLNIYSASLIPPLLPLYLCTPTITLYLYTWRP